MKTLRILSVLVIAALMFSCEKDMKDEVKMGEVSFGIEQIEPLMTKIDAPVFEVECPDDLTPFDAHIVINGVDYFPEVFFVDGKLYTEAIKLAPDTYNVSMFILRDDQGNPIMAIPDDNSDYAVYVTETVDFDIVVEAFEKAQYDVTVLCYEDAFYREFGFTWFYVDRIVVKELCFFGDICIDDAGLYAGSNYANRPGFPTEGFVDAPAIFNVIVKKDGVPVEKSPFLYNLELGGPVCVEYPDRIDVDGEVFTFELRVLVPTNIPGIFDYQLYETFTTTDDLPLAEAIDDEDMVVFSIGDCAFNPDDEIIEIPWLPAPEANETKGFGFRIKGAQGPDVYLGVGDLGTGTNRVQADAGNPLPNGIYPITFAYDGVKMISLTGPNNINLSTDITTYTYTQCGNYNALVVSIQDTKEDAAIQWENVELNGVAIGPFLSWGVLETPGYMEWIIPGDFTDPFTITADLRVEKLIYNESVRAEMTIKCFE